MMELRDSKPLVVGQPDGERAPLPYLFFSGILDRGGVMRLRARTEHFLLEGSDDYTAARQAIGAVGEVIYLVHTPYGHLALLVLDAPGASAVYDQLGGAVRPFHQWLEKRALELFDLPGGKPGPAGYGEQSEVIFRWHA